MDSLKSGSWIQNVSGGQSANASHTDKRSSLTADSMVGGHQPGRTTQFSDRRPAAGVGCDSRCRIA